MRMGTRGGRSGKLIPGRRERREEARLAFVPDKNAEVLGMEVPEFYKKLQMEKELEEEDKEFKMFDDAESD